MKSKTTSLPYFNNTTVTTMNIKKLFTLAVALGTVFCAVAQESDMQQIRHQFYMQQHSRVPQLKETLLQRAPLNEMATPKARTAGALPQDRWFPGEWEEVQAIVITWPYNCYPENQVGNMYYMADEMVTGYGTYYHYNNYMGWQEAGEGPVVNVIDTSAQEYIKVFAYLADAVQEGGAEAWMRITHADDSAAIKRYLSRMALRSDNIKWIVAPGNSFWYRDCGPICFYYGDQDSVGMLDFMYYPGRALDDSLPYAIEAQMSLPNFETSFEWEGGNCLVDGTGMCFTSDAIYAANADTYGQITWDGVNPNTINYTNKQSLSRAQSYDTLAHLIGTRAMYILPTLKYDGGTGHVDLYADMWDENEFVFSRYPAAYSSWSDAKTAQKNIDTLCTKLSLFGNQYKHRNIPFPCTDNGGNFSSQTVYNNQYTRTYSNHTFVNNLIIQPVFSRVENGEPTAAWDKARLDTLRRSYPGYTIYPIDVTTFDGSGGAIHCITKQIPAHNPVRILHPSITGEQGYHYHVLGRLPLEIWARNKSGIAEVKVIYRLNGGEWQEVAAQADSDGNTADGEKFVTELPTTLLQIPEGQTYNTIDYYISVRSHNNKTMTKPMTAGQGGYYTFFVGEESGNNVAISETLDYRFGQFYPNPTTGNASILIEMSDIERCQVEVFDMMGRRVHSDTVAADGNLTLSTAKLGQGVYTVVFTADDHRVVRRLVKK